MDHSHGWVNNWKFIICGGVVYNHFNIYSRYIHIQYVIYRHIQYIYNTQLIMHAHILYIHMYTCYIYSICVCIYIYIIKNKVNLKKYLGELVKDIHPFVLPLFLEIIQFDHNCWVYYSQTHLSILELMYGDFNTEDRGFCDN